MLETYDGLFVFAPNSAIWTFPLRNHSRTAGRLVSFNVGFAPGADLERARAILLEAIDAEPGVLEEPPPEVFVANLTAGAPLATCRFWAARESVGAVQRSMLDAAQRALEAADLPPTAADPNDSRRQRPVAPAVGDALTSRSAWRSFPD